MEKLAVVSRSSRHYGHVCTWEKLRVPWGLGIWGEGPGKADQHMVEGFAYQARNSFTVLYELPEGFFFLLVLFEVYSCSLEQPGFELHESIYTQIFFNQYSTVLQMYFLL